MGSVLASESPALDVIGATFIHELEPGEMVVIDGSKGARCVVSPFLRAPRSTALHLRIRVLRPAG